jgi:hypothetical protein
MSGATVMGRTAARTLGWLAGRRRRALETAWRDPAAVQEQALIRMVAAARDTEFGLAHGFHAIGSVAGYQARVPLREYADFRPLWQRTLAGASGMTWPGRARHWARSAGTTGEAKLIPVTRESRASYRRGGWDALLRAAEQVGAEHLVGGVSLLLGASTRLTSVGDGALAGDASAMVIRTLPAMVGRWYSPSPDLAAMTGWHARLAAMARQAMDQDVRLVAGMPPWLVALFERVVQARAEGGRPVRDLAHCWPQARVLVHGGASIHPYAPAIDEWTGRRLERIEVYQAAEAFLAVQTEARDGLTLMIDHSVFLEFIPVEDLRAARPRRHTVAGVELGTEYAVAVTTPAGLWSYLLGDTVRFTARDPLRLVVTGRVGHVVDACGEHVTAEEIERAIVRACRRTDAEVVELTVAPSRAARPAGHDWLVEFAVTPTEPQEFTRVLDETLCALNTRYRTRRWHDLGLGAPAVISLPRGCFSEWQRQTGRLGAPHKVPRASSGRAVADRLLETARRLGSEERHEDFMQAR